MSQLWSTILTWTLLAAVGGSCVLMSHLGMRTVPRRLQPAANAWVRSGRDPKWIRFTMWVLFAICASLFFGFLFYWLYDSAMFLGTGLKRN